MPLNIEGIYREDLQSVVQLPQQWSTVNGKSKSLVVAQSHEAECLSWTSVEAGILKMTFPTDVLANTCKQVEGEKSPPSSIVLM